MSAQRSRVLTGFVSNLVNYATARGITIDSISESTGINRTALIDHESRLSDEVVPKIWRLIASSSDVYPETLRMASAAPTSVLGPVAQLIRYAVTFGDAIDAVARFSTLLADRVEVRRIELEDAVALQAWHPLDSVDGGYAGEFGIAIVARVLTLCLGKNCIEGVDFAHAPHGSVKAYEKYFGVSPGFEQQHNRLLLRRAVLDHPMREANSNLFEYVQANVELLEDRWRIPGDRDTIAYTYKAAQSNARSGIFTVDALAR
ncbi:MAG: AraC family transcriptional regulator ligand-binding domain-containing protein, partial [Planctomycetota bacterium]